MLLDTHSSIAFLAGYCLEAKLRSDVWPVQRAGLRRIVWRAEQPPGCNVYPAFTQNDLPCTASSNDMAVAISVTHDVVTDVAHYVSSNLPTVGRIMHLRIEPEPNQSAVIDGTHGCHLAQQIAKAIKQRSPHERSCALHIFVAAPNALMFFLGQLAREFGQCVLYEYDFGSSAVGAYQPSITLPRANK